MKRILYIALALCALTSCSDFLKEYSQDMIVAKHPSDLDEVLLGSCYLPSEPIGSGPAGTRMGGFFNILDDDVNTGGDRLDSLGHGSNEVSKAWTQCMAGNYGYFAWQQDVGINYDGSISNDDAATWDALYAHINVANTLLDEITLLPHDTQKDRSDWLRVQGETHFLRAQFYFWLINLYAAPYRPATAAQSPGVPLKLEPGIEFKFTRASVEDVYRQINADLCAADSFLTLSPQNEAHFLHRASAEAVNLLWSRVLLHQQRWAEAAQKAKKVMDSEHFYLAPLTQFAPNAPFLTEENPEVIFSQGSNSLATPSAFTARNGDYCISRDLYQTYDSLDVRRTCFFALYDESSGIANDSVQLAYKYQRGSSLRSHISDYGCLRLSEAYLNRAEALACQGEAPAEALALLNELRSQRIQGYQPQNYTGAELIRQIREERRRELCLEGHRWFDLRRYAVSGVEPWSRPIVHSFGVCGDYVGVMYRRTVVLPPASLNYTFALPKSVVNFFTEDPLETNPRDNIKPLETDNPDDEKQ